MVFAIGMSVKMSQICSLSSPRYIPRYTYEDYCQWKGKWELIEGIPIAMSPAPPPKHQMISTALSEIFVLVLKKTCKTCQIYAPLDWVIKDDTVLQPDLLVVCGQIEKKFLDFPPVLVIEILSPSSAIKDRNAKYQIYESQNVRYYLIVDVTAEKIEIYELVEGQYQPAAVNPDSFEFNLHDDCKIMVSFDELWD